MISPSQLLALPDEILAICHTIADAGEEAYIVGGAVRDALLGRSGLDWDLATTAEPKILMTLFRRVVPTGLAHGTVTVLLGDQQAEITTLRGEGEYKDGRRPSVVTFLKSIDADLARRDFTINAIAWDPLRNELHDPFGGAADIDAGVIRAVGDAAKRFTEDGLRVLRAARFAATLAFEVAPETLAAIPAAAPSLINVSHERKRDELTKLLSAPTPSRGLSVLRLGELVPILFAEFVESPDRIDRGSVDGDLHWDHLCAWVDHTPQQLPLRLAALLYDIGTTTVGEDIFGDGPDNCDTSLAQQWLTQSKFDKKTTARVLHLLHHVEFTDVQAWTDGQVRRFVQRSGRENVGDLIALRRAECRATGRPKTAMTELNELETRIAALERQGMVLAPSELAINGGDLMSHLSLKPGRQIGDILAALLDHLIEHPQDNSTARLLELARHYLRQQDS